jgi:hypothetical protein
MSQVPAHPRYYFYDCLLIAASMDRKRVIAHPRKG